MNLQSKLSIRKTSLQFSELHMNELNAFNLGFWLPDFSIFVLILNVAFGLWTVHQNRKKARKHVKISFKKKFR